MAGGFYTAVEGADFPPDTFNEYVRDQTLSRFTSSGARSAAITSPSAGQPSYLATGSGSEGPEFYTTGGDWLPTWNVSWGEVSGGYVTKTSTTTFTTLQDISGLSITFTAIGNRRYRISAECHLFSTVANDIMQLVIADSTPTTLQVAQVSTPSTSFGAKAACSVDVTPSAGSVTYKIRAVRSSGSGTCTFDCGAVYPAFIRIEDIGPNGAPL